MGEQLDEGMAGMDLRDHSVASLAERVRRRELSARELIEVSLARIETANPTINAWASLDASGARAQADDIDRRLAGGEDVGPLAGIPIGVKDLEDAAGFVTGYGSAYCASDAPAVRDSIEVARLRAAGCVVIGKTTTSEFGYAGDTVTPHWGATVNPWDTNHPLEDRRAVHRLRWRAAWWRWPPAAMVVGRFGFRLRCAG